MGDAKLASGDTDRRRVLYVSAGASHTVALLCNLFFLAPALLLGVTLK